MSTARIKALDAAIRQALKPHLSEQGFAYDAGSRTFRRKVADCTQIINVQVGVRSAEGYFTVNLAAFHPEYWVDARNSLAPEKPMEFHCLERERLSILRDTVLTRMFRPRIHSPDNFLKWWLVTPRDKWWPFSSNEIQNVRELESLSELLLTRGIHWLDTNSTATVLRTAYEKLRHVPTGA